MSDGIGHLSLLNVGAHIFIDSDLLGCIPY